ATTQSYTPSLHDALPISGIAAYERTTRIETTSKSGIGALYAAWASYEERRGVALALAQQLDGALTEVENRGWVDAAHTRVQNDVDVLLDARSKLLGVRQRQIVSRKLKRRADQWLAEDIQQRVDDLVRRHADAHGALLGVLKPARRFVGRLEHERERARRQGANQSISRVIHTRVVGDLRQIPADQAELMASVDPTQSSNAVQSSLVRQPTPERIGRIGRVHDDGTFPQRIGGTLEEPPLRVDRVHLEVEAHGAILQTTPALPRGASPYLSGSLPRRDRPVRYHGWAAHPECPAMQLLIDLFPIIVFFVAYKVAGMYWATGATMAATAVLLALQWARERKISNMLLITAALVVVLGAITIAFRNPLFFQWKPTVVNWLFAAAFLVSEFFGKKNLTERMLGHAIELDAALWRQLNYIWVANFTFLGAANL